MDKTTDKIKADALKAAEGIGDEHRKNAYYHGHRDGATAENNRLQPVIDALAQFIARHEGGLLPDRFTYEKGVKALEQWKGMGKEPVKEIEYMPIHPDDASKFDCPTQFPMHLLNEDQAYSNHGQTLKRLKERGGLSVREILAIVGNKDWSYYGGLQWPEAIKMLNDLLTNPTK